MGPPKDGYRLHYLRLRNLLLNLRMPLLYLEVLLNSLLNLLLLLLRLLNMRVRDLLSLLLPVSAHKPTSPPSLWDQSSCNHWSEVLSVGGRWPVSGQVTNGTTSQTLSHLSSHLHTIPRKMLMVLGNMESPVMRVDMTTSGCCVSSWHGRPKGCCYLSQSSSQMKWKTWKSQIHGMMRDSRSRVKVGNCEILVPWFDHNHLIIDKEATLGNQSLWICWLW